MKLTAEEEAMLESASSNDEWNAACVKIKKARDGAYPSDWWGKVLGDGQILHQFQERTGQDVGPGIQVKGFGNRT